MDWADWTGPACPRAPTGTWLPPRPASRGLSRPESQLVRALLHRRDHERHVLVEVHAELLGSLAHLVAVHSRGEARLLQLLLDRLRSHPMDPVGAHVRARRDEA